MLGLKQVRGEVCRRKDVSVSRCCVKYNIIHKYTLYSNNPLGYFEVEFPTELIFSRCFIGNNQFLKPTLLSLIEVNSRRVLTEFSPNRALFLESEVVNMSLKTLGLMGNLIHHCVFHR